MFKDVQRKFSSKISLRTNVQGQSCHHHVNNIVSKSSSGTRELRGENLESETRPLKIPLMIGYYI